MIEPPFQGRVWLSASLSNSELTIQPVAIQDEGCYTCLYNTHPDGPKTSTICLTTFGKPIINADYFILCFIKVWPTHTEWAMKT